MGVSLRLKSRSIMCLLLAAMIATLLSSATVLGLTQPPLSRIPVPVPRSNAELAQARYGGPNGLAAFVKDVPSAIQLGKAFFWDMQAGSDGFTACASCHYRAGADPLMVRSRNQLHPGPDSIFGNNSTLIRTPDPVTAAPITLRATGMPRFAADYLLQQSDFPFFQLFPLTARLLIDPLTGLTTDPVSALSDTNDVVGSQGVRRTDFIAVNAGSEVDLGTPLPDSLFHVGPAPNSDPANNSRQVTARNAPTVINAVFNMTNFWDGRANPIFNGVNPFGPLDQEAGIWGDNGSGLRLTKVAIPNSSLASQATGQPLGAVEMSYKGRTFPELGRKLLQLSPLKKQHIHPADSVLGPFSNASLSGNGVVGGNSGITLTYPGMIKSAFQAYLWNSPASVSLATIAAPSGEPFSQMEANFSLFWGLAIQLYEATLVSDKAPFDRFQAGNSNALTLSAQNGFATFDSKCAICHSGSEFTNAVVGSSLPLCAPPDCNPSVFTNNTTHHLIQQEVNLTTLAISLVDTGFMNIGVRPTADDPGRGGGAPFNNSRSGQPFPLSFSRLARLGAQGQLPFVTPALPGGVGAGTTDAVQGAFKVPGLRNVELTAPYFHNGAFLDLAQVVQFYSRGGNFPNNPELDVAMQPIRNLRGNTVKQAELVEFLTTLTDERVKNETAPFDHPELIIPAGDLADTPLIIPASGGSPPPLAPALTLNPVTTPTSLTSQLFSGTVDPTATVQVQVNNQTPLFAIVSGNAWSVNVTALPVGNNTISFTAVTPSGGVESRSASVTVLPSALIFGLPPGGSSNRNSITLTIFGEGVLTYRYSLDGAAYSAEIPVATPLVLDNLSDALHSIAVVATAHDRAGNPLVQSVPTTASWAVKVNPPLLTLNPVISPTRLTSQTIGGTVESGSIPTVTVAGGATVGAVRTVGGNGISSWSCDISGLVRGTNTITVTALDFVFNRSTTTAAITIILPDGDFKGSGTSDLSDALKALRIAVGLQQPTTADMLHGDVAPLLNGLPAPDGTIDIADALTILRKVIGLISF